jgi:hypothetical protein
MTVPLACRLDKHRALGSSKLATDSGRLQTLEGYRLWKL